MDTFTSNSPEDTLEWGERLGRAAQAGWVIGITGPLGAGKTQLVKGIARGLGLGSRVQSPSYTLVNVHRGGRLPLYHLDLYRLDTASQILAAGLEEYLYPVDGMTVVEWYERWTGPAPAGVHRVILRPAGETRRVIEYDAPGS